MSIVDPSLKVPGNAAMKDQAMAMRWVRENIRHFGGDDQNITIFGESVGGISVHWHMISDFSKGLFDKAIVQSGSALADFCAIRQTIDWAERLARTLRWDPSKTSLSYFEYLQSVPAVDIVMVQDSLLSPAERKLYGNMVFATCLEPYESEQCFNTRDPLEFYHNAWSNKIPLIIGGTSEEGLLFYRLMTQFLIMFKAPDLFENIFERLKCGKGTDKSRDIAQKIRTFYYGDETPSIQNIDTYIDVISDKNFLHGMHTAVKARINDPESASTYCYRFNFETKTNFTSMKSVFGHPNIKGELCNIEKALRLQYTEFN